LRTIRYYNIGLAIAIEIANGSHLGVRQSFKAKEEE
jgi:hypothetical protein